MEWLDIVDENGMPTGRSVSRDEAHRKGLRHRTVHVWVIRETPDGAQVLLQKRSRDKDSFPGCWDISCAGHISAGDDVLPSALREAKEELGLDIREDELIPNGIIRLCYSKEFYGEMFCDNEIAFQFVLEKDIDEAAVICQPEEVEEVKWFSMAEIIRNGRENGELFAYPTEDIGRLCEYIESREK